LASSEALKICNFLPLNWGLAHWGVFLQQLLNEDVNFIDIELWQYQS